MALAVLSIAVTPVTEVGKYLVGKIKTEFDYVTKHDSYLLKFQEELLELQVTREEVEEDVEKARKELQEPRRKVLDWVQKVKDLEEECTPLTTNNSTNNKCLMVLRCSRRRISKKILKLTIDICDLKEKGSFTCIAHQLPSPEVVYIDQTGIVENFRSRKLIVKEVVEALEDPNIKSIGVFGMGGIGKTTLVTSINNELLKTSSSKKVIMVTVSKDPDKKKIQDKIAGMLGLKLEEQDMDRRADKLRQRLKSEESMLIILDDVWNVMELGKIGLQHSTEPMPCKFIVTTRNVDVCRGMEVQKVVPMDILPEDEAWTLFAAKAGNVVDEMPSLEPTAREIVRRCKGSPLAITVLGSTLRAVKEEPIWAHALQVLKEPNAMGSDAIMLQVVTSLKWSYDHLKDNPNAQLCFLYCCLFPEDCSINLNDLRNYGVGDGFLKMTSTLKKAQNELLYYVKILKDCCLLLDGDDEGSVKMHDVVRDVAILIASDCKDGFLVNIGGGSKYLPESDKLLTYKRISFMDNKDIGFPNSLECPQLRSLLVRESDLETNYSFEGVKSLLVLHMSCSWTWLSVPKSISQLRNLRTLYLDGCDLFDKTYLLGGLTKLEVLSMRGSKIGELPVEFGNLINLKFLDLRDASIDFVAPNVFSRFSNMEELYIDKAITGWNTTGELEDDYDDEEEDGYGDDGRWCITDDGSRRFAELKEVLSLPRLSLLDIKIDRPLLDGEVLNSHNLQNFRISVGVRGSGQDFSYDKNALYIGSTDLGKHWIRNLIAVSNKSMDLILYYCGGFKSVTDLNPAGSFNHLQYLHLRFCNDVESVIVADRSAITTEDSSFERLERLKLYEMDKMERILHGATSSPKFLGKLEELSVRYCPKICTIFPSNLLFTGNRLENLKEVRVESCDEVQHIFNTEDNEFGATPATTALLCGITRIRLSELPKLKSIWKGIMPEGSFQGLTRLSASYCPSLKHLLPSHVAGLLQNLEEIVIEDCAAMETMICPIGEEAEETSLFPRCRLLTIDYCPKLKNIFSFGVAGHLHKLNKLSISHCHGLRQIFGNGDEPRVTEHRCLLPELKYLELVDLKCLTRFDQDNLPISGPLQTIHVFVCPNLVRLPLQTVSALKLFQAEDIWFKRLESEDGSLASMLQPFFQPCSQDVRAPIFHGIDGKLETLLWKVAGLWLDDYDSQLECTTHLQRLLLDITWSVTIEDVVRLDVVPCLVEFLNREDHTQLQSEAAWVLAYIASGSSDHSKVVIDHGAVPIFVKLLCSPNEDIREHAIWALGNVAADSPQCRDIVLGHGALVPLLAQLSECGEVSIMRNALWAISNFFAVKPQPPFELVKLALPSLQCLLHSKNEILCIDACCALSCLLDATSDIAQAVTEIGILPQLVELLIHPSSSVLISSLHAIGNIVCRDNGQTLCTCIIDNQALPYICNLLTHHDVSIKKDACLIISEITAGNKECIQSVIVANIIAPLVHLLETAEFDIKKEAARAISNATCHGTQKQIKHLVKQGCLRPFCDLLKCSDSSIIVVCLQGLSNILKVGITGDMGIMNRYVQIIDDYGGLENIVYFQGHHNSDIQQKAVDIVKSFQLEKYTPSAGDAAITSFQYGESKSNCVEKETISSAETESPASKCKQIDLNYPPSSPIEIAKERQVDQMPDEEPYVRDIRNNAFVKIYDNSRQSSSTELAMASHIIRTPEKDLRFIETWRNVSMKLDLNSLPSSTTELENESYVSQMSEHEGYLISDLSNASVKDNHESDSTVWDSISTATTSMHDEVWNDQSIEDYGMTGADDPLCMLSLSNVEIDDNSLQSSSAELAKQSHVIQTPEQALHLVETRRNSSMKLDLNSLSSSSTEPEMESHVSQMPEQEGYLIGNSSNVSVKDNHESDSTVWDNSPNEVMGESTSTATTSVHDEVWHNQSKNHTSFCKHEHENSTGLEQSKTTSIQVAESCTGQESSSDYTITESMKTLNDMDMNIGRITYIRAVKLLQEKGWREAFMNMPDARRKDLILSIDARDM